MTDLPDLLEPRRILCGCEIRSKKRALQTVAELLGESLRDADTSHADDGAHAVVLDDDGTETVEGLLPAPSSRERRRARRKAGDEPGHAISDMDILDALITRERLGSTGIGHGIALPHSRMAQVDHPLAALVTLREGVDFESIDGDPVDIVLGLLVPEDCNDEHLKILAGLARRFSDADFRERLRDCRDGEDLYGRLGAVPTAG